MKRFFLLIGILTTFANAFAGNVDFNTYFLNKTLRVDLMHTGSHSKSEFSFYEIKEEPFWGGSKINLVDTFNYGTYKVSIVDKLSS